MNVPRRCRARTGHNFGGLRSHKENMVYSGTDPESYITEYTLVYEDLKQIPGILKERDFQNDKARSRFWT